MANNIKMPAKKELRVPAGWEGQERQLVIQLNELYTDLYRVLAAIVKKLNEE